MKGKWKWVVPSVAALCLLLLGLFCIASDISVSWGLVPIQIAAVILGMELVLLIRDLLLPLGAVERILEQWSGTEHTAVQQQLSQVGGSMAGLARLLGRKIEELECYAAQIGEKAAAKAGEETRRQMAEEISRSALPRVLGKIDGRENFEIAGHVERIGKSGNTFYDFFVLDSGVLGVVLGQVPGEDVADAMYMVVAQTTIRSRLRLGRSLEETMDDVNSQLYDLGAHKTLHAIVGILNTADGWFTYVNAGQQRPLLMRNEEGYEWLDGPRFAPIGQNERVNYRTESLRLRQGDRLFLHSEGLGGCLDQSGTAFREHALRSALNRSRKHEEDLETMLSFISDEAAAFCTTDAEVPGYAMLLIEYRKGNKDLAHLEELAVPEAAGRVAAFLKKQFAQNGIEPKRYAKVAVVADEMFALCCRRLPDYAHITTECGLAPDGQSVTIRISAPLGGTDPMENAADEVDQSSIDFISAQTDFISFKPGAERDSLVAVCFWE